MGFRLAGLLAAAALFTRHVSSASCDPGESPILYLRNCTSSTSSSVKHWGVFVTVGEPKQNLCMMPATVTDNIHLISENLCPNSTESERLTCEARHGNTYDNSSSTTYTYLPPSDERFAEDKYWTEIINAPYGRQFGGEDVFNFGPGLGGGDDDNAGFEKIRLAFDHVMNGWQFAEHLLPFGKDSRLLSIAKEKGLSPCRCFGLNLGSRSVKYPRKGSVILGPGIDRNAVQGDFEIFDVSTDKLPSGEDGETDERPCPLRVRLQSMSLLVAEDGKDSPREISLYSPGDNPTACIEPYDEKFRLTSRALNAIKVGTNWKEISLPQTDETLWIPERGLLYSNSLEMTLEIVLYDNFKVTIPTHEIVNPLRGIQSGEEVIPFPNITETVFFDGVAPNSALVLGRAFLAQVYLAVNYDMAKFALGSIPSDYTTNIYAESANPAVTHFPQGIRPKCDSDGEKNIGAIVGGTVGGVVFLLLLAGLFWWWRRRKSTSDSEATDVEGPRETGEDRHVSRHGIFWRHSPPRKGHHRASLETSEVPEITVGEEDERPRSPRGFNVWRVGESPR